MKYYHWSIKIDDKDVGVYPQSTECKSLGSIQEFGIGVNEPLQHIILPEIILRDNSKLTDFLSVTAINRSVFLVLKNHFIDFLKNFKIADFQSWNIDIYHKKQLVNDYSLFHLSYPIQQKVIDFEKSKFKIKDISNNILKEKKYINYHSYQTDWKKLIWEGSVITFDTLYLDFSGLNLDLIRIINIDSIGIGYYVSEKLKNAIEKQGFTGMAFQEIEEVDKRIKVIY